MQERCEPRVQRCVVGDTKESRRKEEEALWCLIGSRAVQVGAMLEQAEQPVESVGQLVPSPAGVEQSEDVQRSDRVDVWLFCIEVHL